MSLDSLINNRIKNRKVSFIYQYGHGKSTSMSFPHNPNYITDKLLCNKLRKLLKIKVVLTITGIILIIPILITGILVVRHVIM